MSRPKLLSAVDTALKTGHLWISAPAGSGKTSLASSYLETRSECCAWYQMDAGDTDPATFFYYLGLAAKRATPHRRRTLPLLTPEYLSNIPTFARRFFEQFYERLSSPALVVFDNYHELSSCAVFHDLFNIGLAFCPGHVKIIVLSREGPPPSLARLIIEGKLMVMGWEDIRLTRAEADELLSRHKLGAAVLEDLHTATEGWIAGLIFLLGQLARNDGGFPQSPDYTHIFNYFTHEVLARLDQDTVAFLYRTAFAPAMTVGIAERLTATEGAGRVLQELHKKNCFIEKARAKENTYRYHPLFREFLLARASETFTESQRLEICRTAASLLAEAGQVEYAASLYKEGGHHRGLAELTKNNARELLSQGRNQVLTDWLTALPGDVIAGDPWLSYWFGSCRMPYSPKEAREHFEQALSGFDQQSDSAGVFISWSGVVESIMHELSDLKALDSWLDHLDRLMAKYAPLPPGDIEDNVASRVIMALALRKPDHPDFDRWKDKALAILDKREADPTLKMLTGFYLFTTHIWLGALAGAGFLIERLQTMSEENSSPLARVTAGMASSWYLWHVGMNGKCLEAMAETLETAASTGVHLWDYLVMVQGVVSSLSSGKVEGAAGLLSRLEGSLGRVRGFDRFYYYHQLAWKSLLEGNLSAAFVAQQKAVATASEVGVVFGEGQAHFGMSLVLHELGDNEGAKEHLELARRHGHRLKSLILEFMCRLAETQYAFARGDEEGGLPLLIAAFQMGREKGFFNYSWWNPRQMALLCSKALQHRIEPDYTRELIRKRNLLPQQSVDFDDWPWYFKIRLLGRFEMEKESETVRFKGRIPQKPLEMLQVITAFGGLEIHEEQITEALWPDADGDLAISSLRTNLHRLRKILGRDDALTHKAGRLSLAQTLFWTDLWAFERLIDKADCKWKSAGADDAAKLYVRAIALYRGHFLQHETAPWVLAVREKIKSRLLRALGRLGMHLENTGSLDQALELYQNGLEQDDLAEELWIGFMRCLHKLGRRTEATRAFNRFCETIDAQLDIKPSSGVKELGEIIKSGRKIP